MHISAKMRKSAAGSGTEENLLKEKIVKLPVLMPGERDTVVGRVVRLLALLFFTCAMGWIIYLFCKDRLENWETREYFMAVAGGGIDRGCRSGILGAERTGSCKMAAGGGVGCVCGDSAGVHSGDSHGTGQRF